MRKILFVLMLIVSLCVSAKNEKTPQAVTMVDYEQRGIDYEGTLSLRNNTDKTIRRVNFRITYLDMNGTQLDYHDFSESTEIAPRMTKKVDIAAYEHNRNYYYYKSEGSYDGKKFKIKFQLTSYEYDEEASTDSLLTDSYDMDSAPRRGFMAIVVPAILLFILFVGVYVGLYILVAFMAKNRYRNPALWVLVSIFATPLLAVIILLALGKDYNSREYMAQQRNQSDANDRWEEEEYEDNER